jgi:hypothetical protein
MVMVVIATHAGPSGFELRFTNTGLELASESHRVMVSV